MDTSPGVYKNTRSRNRVSSSNKTVIAETKTIDTEELTAFLVAVASGQQQKAQEFLEKNSELAKQVGKLIDPSGREFKEITAFQYAVWSLDFDMWQMLLEHLSAEDISSQLSELLTTGTDHGDHAEWNKLIEILENVYGYELYSKDKPRTLKAAVLILYDNIAAAQLALPAHVVQAYCSGWGLSGEIVSDFSSPVRRVPTLVELFSKRTVDWYEHIKAQDQKQKSRGITSSSFKGFMSSDGGIMASELFIPDRCQVETDTDDLDDMEVPGFNMYDNLVGVVEIEATALSNLYSKRVRQFNELCSEYVADFGSVSSAEASSSAPRCN